MERQQCAWKLGVVGRWRNHIQYGLGQPGLFAPVGAHMCSILEGTAYCKRVEKCFFLFNFLDVIDRYFICTFFFIRIKKRDRRCIT